MTSLLVKEGPGEILKSVFCGFRLLFRKGSGLGFQRTAKDTLQWIMTERDFKIKVSGLLSVLLPLAKGDREGFDKYFFC